MTQPDTITLIECKPGHTLAKRYTNPAKPPLDYDAGFWFRPLVEPIEDLAALRALLTALIEEPTFAVIRGEPEPDAVGEWVPKRSIDRVDADAAFKAHARRWLAIDVDDSVEPMPCEDLVAGKHLAGSPFLFNAVERWRETLPDGLRQADMVWIWSAKAHLSPTIRGRAWFWLAEPAADAPLRAWAEANGFDPALYNPVQPHFTAAPVFDQGSDPLVDLRIQWHGGTERVARVDLAARPGGTDQAGPGAVRERAVRPEWSGGTERFAEARAQILDALGDPADHQNRKWYLCGHLGGMLCKLGWPQGDVEDLVATWLDVGDPSIDVVKGVERAVGAYGLADPATATGRTELETLLDDPGLARDLERAALRPTLSERRRAELDRPATAPTPKPRPEPVPGPSPVEPADPLASIGRIVDRSRLAPALDWRVEDVLAPGKVSVLFGPPEAGKGPLALWLALSVALGRPVFGPDRWPTAPCPVVYFDSETGSLAEERDARMCNALGVPRTEVPLTFVHGEAFFSEKMLTALDAGVRARGAKLVIVDTYGSTLPGDVDHNAAEFSAWLKALARVGDGDVTVLVLMHAKKGSSGVELEDLSGNFSAAGAAQSVIRLVPKPGGQIEVRCARHPRTKWAPFTIRWVDVDGPRFNGGASWGLRPELVAAPSEDQAKRAATPINVARQAEAVRSQLDAGRRIWAALAKAPAAMSRAELVALSGEGGRPARRALALLVESGVVELLAGHYSRAPGQKVTEVRLRTILAGVPAE